MESNIETVKIHLNDKPVFRLVADAAAALAIPCYAVGGYVRDLFSTVPPRI